MACSTINDLRQLDPAARAAAADLLSADEARGPLSRVRLLRLADDEHLALLTMHHSIADGWSMGVLIEELGELYAAAVSGRASALPALPVQYADYAIWQREWLASAQLQHHLDYWRRWLEGCPPSLELPTDRPRPAVPSYQGAFHSFSLPRRLTYALRVLSQREGATLFMALLAGLQVLLSRYSGQKDLCVGTPIAGRTSAELEPLIGCFVNTLALRGDLAGAPSFRALLRQVRETTLDAYAHQSVPFELVVDAVQPERSLDRTPLFQVMFSMQNTPAATLALPDLELSAVEPELAIAPFDLTLTLEEQAEGLSGGWEYRTDLFDEATITRMAGHFQTLLSGLVAAPERSIAAAPLLSAGERDVLIADWNATAGPFAHERCLHELVAAQAARTPEAIALIAGAQRLSYAELEAQASRLAHYLRARGVGPGALAALVFERSPELLVAMLGVLKAGAAYLPLDPSYPAERLEFMLTDAHLRLLITTRALLEGCGLAAPAAAAAVELLLLDDAPIHADAPHPAPPCAAGPDNLAYVIYSSGSTGRPKGALITHRGLLDLATFTRAWQRAIERHAILRTAFVGEGLREPAQVVARQVTLPLIHADWRALPPAEQEARLAEYLRDDLTCGFTLARAPLLRLALFQVADEAHWFAWSFHHALLDGWSVPLLLREVFAAYASYCCGLEPALPHARPYRDYIAWLRRQDLGAAEQFWRRELAGLAAPTPLAIAHPPAAADESAPRYAECELRLSIEETATLQTFARRHQLTLNTLLQGAWALLLSRYSGEPDVLFGATVAGRPPELAGAESMLGLFINTLPVRAQAPPTALTLDWLRELQARQVALRQYDHTPLVQVQAWSELPRGVPLFASLLVFENFPLAAALRDEGASLTIEAVRSADQTNYPLTLVAGVADELMLRLLYERARFAAASITDLLGHLRNLLLAMIAHAQRPLAELPMLTPDERRLLLEDWNATACPFPSGIAAHQLFEAHAARDPAAPALRLGEAVLSYGELNRRANQLAQHLRRQGLAAEQLVAICAERSFAQIIAVLAVLKAGGAYLPLDPSHPRERLGSAAQSAAVAPRDEIEQALAAIWAEVLGAELPGVTADLFELGAHSLLAAPSPPRPSCCARHRPRRRSRHRPRPRRRSHHLRRRHYRPRRSHHLRRNHHRLHPSRRLHRNSSYRCA